MEQAQEVTAEYGLEIEAYAGSGWYTQAYNKRRITVRTDDSGVIVAADPG